MYIPYFTITPKITRCIEAIGVVFGYFQAIQMPEGYRRELVSKITAETVHTSTAIEGNTLTQSQVEAVLSGQSIHAQAVDIQEILNYNQALKSAEKIAKSSNTIILEQTLCDFNSVILKDIRNDIAGSYRLQQVIVGDYLPPEHYKVPQLMSDFVSWLNNPTPAELSPILYAGIAHYQFVAIHPFEDGNGRTTRVLTSLLLLRHGYAITSLFALESYYNRNRRAYYQALSSADQYRVDGEPDLTIWLEYYVEGLLIEAERARSRIEEQLQRQKVGKHAILLQEHQKHFLQYVAEHGKAKTSDYIELSELSRKGVYNAIRQLVNLGLLDRHGSGRGTFYTLTDSRASYL